MTRWKSPSGCGWRCASAARSAFRSRSASALRLPSPASSTPTSCSPAPSGRGPAPRKKVATPPTPPTTSPSSPPPRDLAAEVPVAAEPLAEGGEQFHDRLDVAQVDHLDRRVHVSQRDRDEPGGDAGAGDLEDVGVGAGAAAAGADRVLDPLGLGGLDQELEDLRRESGAAADCRAGAERVAADLLLVDAGGVGGVGHIDGDRDVRPHVEGGGAGAEEADLLLHGGDGGKGTAGAFALGAAAQALEGDVGAEPVVHRAGDEAVADDRHRLGRDHHRVADPDQRLGLLAVGGADVDVHALQLDDLLALVGLEQVDRLAAGDAEDGTAFTADLDPLADEDLRIPAADRGKPEEALLIDVGDD